MEKKKVNMLPLRTILGLNLISMRLKTTIKRFVIVLLAFPERRADEKCRMAGKKLVANSKRR